MSLFNPLIIAGGAVFGGVFLIRTRDPLAIVIALLFSLPTLACVYLIARRYLPQLPVEIRIEDHSISLYRYCRYRTFDLDSVVSVITSLRPPFSRLGPGLWGLVEYKFDGKQERFYIAPYISGFWELVEILERAAPHTTVE